MTRMLSFAIIATAVVASGNALPDTVYLPVIFYDYRADGSNPAFQQEVCRVGRQEGLVDSTLGPNRKPVLNLDGAPVDYPAQCYQTLGQWFWPSGTNGPSNAVSFYYDGARWRYSGLSPRPGGTMGEYIAADYTENYEMSNIVIYDSLPFYLYDSTDATYRFQRIEYSSHPGFFGIDDRGYGNEPDSVDSWTNPGHNYGFSMELHHKFIYRRGLRFNFLGDDDVWVFINDSLMIDLGGLHQSLEKGISLDGLSGWLKEDSVYSLDLFYCERHTTGSNIRITTNIFTGNATHDRISVAPLQPFIVAGDYTHLHVALLTAFGDTLPQGDSKYRNVTWELVNPEPGDELLATVGPATTLYGTKAHRSAHVRATYTDPSTGEVMSALASVPIVPTVPHRVMAEKTDWGNFWECDSVVEAIVPSDPQIGSDTLYAILRDIYGNKVTNHPMADSAGHALSATWSIVADGQSFAAVALGISQPWKATVSRILDTTGKTELVVSSGTLLADTVDVVVQPPTDLVNHHSRPWEFAIGKIAIDFQAGRVTLPYTAPSEGKRLSFSVYDIRGRLVKRLSGPTHPGPATLTFPLSTLGGRGMYFLSVEAPDRSYSIKLF